jgi:hypothetical protein
VKAVYSNDLENLAEIRTVTTMFVNLNSYSGETFFDLRKMQPFFLAMQVCMCVSLCLSLCVCGYVCVSGCVCCHDDFMLSLWIAKMTCVSNQ